MTPRVLWCTAEHPDPDGGGGGLRQAALLQAVARRAAVTVLLAAERANPFITEIAHEVVVVRSAAAPSAFARARTAAAALVGHGVPEVDHTRATCQAILDVLARRPDLQRAEFSIAHHLPLAPILPALPGGRIFHPFHVPSLHLGDEARLRSGLRRAALGRYAAGARRWERRAVWAADRTVTVCAADRSHFAAMGSEAAVAEVPNGVDVARYRAMAPRPDAPVVLFPASFDFEPNVDGARWFVTEVWPLVLRRRPDARLLLVGRRPVAEVRRLTQAEGVELHADVPDMVPWLERARAVVVPLRFGTGTRLKALEAMAAQRPLVGTSVGLAGLGLCNGATAAIADAPAAMADALVEVLHDGEALRHQAFEHVQAYDWATLGQRFAELVLSTERTSP